MSNHGFPSKPIRLIHATLDGSKASILDSKILLTIVQVEQEAAHVLVVHLSPAIGLVLRDDLPAVLRDEFVLLGALLQEYSPPGHVRRCHQEMFICWVDKKSFYEIEPDLTT